MLSGGDLKKSVDETVTEANAQNVTITITATPTSGGALSLSGSQSKKVGVPFSLTASAYDAYYFAGWTATGSGNVSFSSPSSSTTTATIGNSASDIVISANFTKRATIIDYMPILDTYNGTYCNMPIYVQFSKAMDPSSFNAGTISVTAKPTGVSGATPIDIYGYFELTTASDGFTLSPTTLMPTGHKVTVTLSNAIRDAQLNNLAEDESWYFVTNSLSDTTKPTLDSQTIRKVGGATPYTIAGAYATASRSILINSVANTNTAAASIKVSSIGITEKDETTGVSVTNWYGYLASLPYTLKTDGDGLKTLTYQVMNNLSTYSDIAADDYSSVLLETVPPTVVLSCSDADNLAKPGDALVYTATFSEANEIDEAIVPKITIGSYVTNGPMVRTSNLVWTYTWTAPDAAVANAALSVSAYDKPGNASAAATGDIAVSIDNIKPTVTLAKDHVDAIVSSADTVVFTATFSEALASTPTINISNGTYTGGTAYPLSAAMSPAGGNTYTCTWYVPANPGAGATVSFTATDIAGNTVGTISGATTSYTIDNTGPTVTLANGHGDTVVRDADTVSFTATFNETLAGTPTIVIDVPGTGADISTAMGGAGTVWTYSWNVPTGSTYDGTAAVSFSASDVAGNPVSGIIGAASFRIDNTPPTAPETPTKGSAYINAAETTVTVRVTLPSSGSLAEVDDVLYLRVGGSSIASRTLTASDLSDGYYDFVLAGTAYGVDGAKSVTALITDLAGNPSDSSGTLNLTKDLQAPTLSVGAITTSGTAPYAKNGDTITIPFTITEATSGLAVNPTVSIAGQPADLEVGTVSGNVHNFTARLVVPIDTLGEAELEYTISGAQDGAGNAMSSSTESTGLIHDRTPPTAAVSGTPSYAGVGNLVFTLTMTENLSGMNV
ncbi:MAG TPA: hypothetical protein P5142_07865, partial [Spirochaetia bacterium]|nr:hypothetical protein [Spirochaetia bacterium]